MAKHVKTLTDTEVKNLKPKEKDYKICDGNNLYLVVRKSGIKFFRFDFFYNNKRQSMSLGNYPEVSLKEAREKRNLAKENLLHGINPIQSQKSNFKLENTFKFVSERWLELQKDSWSYSNYNKIKSNLENNAFPFIGNIDIKDLTRKDILKLTERMEKRNAIEYANRLLNNIQRIYKYAVTNEYCDYNILSDIDKTNSLKQRQSKNVPAITSPEDIKELLLDINNYGTNFKADISTIYALKISPYLALRPYNIRYLEWSEVNFEDNYLDIAAEKMKMKIDFVLPLSKQALDILKELKNISFSSKFVFPSPTSNSKAISENTMNHALHKMGYKDKHTSHGFRAMFSTICHDNIKSHELYSDIIESCLAHAELNTVKKAYNRESKFKYFNEKKDLMQWWADWLDKL
ncbi:tyrosine-type recombinase/integrase [Aliarcobacter butzleri]|uniref:tyrosine-type recombinase/integrase n=1 Tax=Aliarcobacter butzleri TaxID=28197 RepID=UPI003AF71F2E